MFLDLVYKEHVMASYGSVVYRESGDAKETFPVFYEIAASFDSTVAKLVALVRVMKVVAKVSLHDLVAVGIFST
jgi:hypothetical protein